MNSILKIIKKYQEQFLITSLILLAVFPRVLFLTDNPPGFHGDEAWTGIDAIRIQNEGIIEPYVGSALGQPIGPAYLTAFIFELFGPSQWSIRFSMALFGIITIPLFYIFVRQFFGSFSSYWATFTLTLSLYHIHYSRIGFMLISAPVFQLLTLIFLTFWIKKQKNIYAIVAGIVLGLGLYTYNTFIFFPFMIPFFLVSFLSIKKLANRWRGLLLFILTFIVISYPLIRVVLFDSDYYFSHAKTVSSISKISTEGITLSEIHSLNKDFLTRTYDFLNGHNLDYGDGYGSSSSFNYIVLFTILFTVIYVLFTKKRKHSFAVVSLLICLLPLYLTVDGLYRRQIIGIIFLYYLFAVFIQLIINKSDQFKTTARIYISIILLAIASYSAMYYFKDYPKDTDAKYIFAYTLTKTAYEIKSRYPNEHYAFYSQRWSCKYETLIFLLKNTCDNYSREFGEFKEPQELNNIKMFVFLDSYIQYGQKLISTGSFKSTIITDENTNETIGIVAHRK